MANSTLQQLRLAQSCVVAEPERALAIALAIRDHAQLDADAPEMSQALIIAAKCYRNLGQLAEALITLKLGLRASVRKSKSNFSEFCLIAADVAGMSRDVHSAGDYGFRDPLESRFWTVAPPHYERLVLVPTNLCDRNGALVRAPQSSGALWGKRQSHADAFPVPRASARRDGRD